MSEDEGGIPLPDDVAEAFEEWMKNPVPIVTIYEYSLEDEPEIGGTNVKLLGVTHG